MGCLGRRQVMHEILTAKVPIKDIISNLYSINQSIDNSFDLLHDSIPKTKNELKNKDTRSVTLINLRETVNQLIVSYTIQMDTLFNKNWIDSQKHFIFPDENPKYISDRIYTLGVFLDSSFLMYIFSEIESYFRDLFNTIPQDFRGKVKTKDSFWKIRDVVFQYFKINLNSINLLKILNHMRNSFHSSGHHFGRDESVVYDDVEYKFKGGEPIKINPLNFVVYYKHDLFAIINEINCSEKSKINEYIPHSVSNIKFVDK